MSAREGLLERLLDWAAGAFAGVRSPCGPADNASSRARAYEEEFDDRREREREIELRVLMSTWM
jgi:hypothetical protein